MQEKVKQKLQELQSGFFGFWTSKIRVSVLLLILLISSGLYSLYVVPKESAPNVDVGIVSINTVYPGVNPTDMDKLITEKIEKEIEDIDGIKSIDSTSSVGLSSLIVNLETGVIVRDVLTDIKDKVDKVEIPSEANDPIVTEINTSNGTVFSLYLYGSEEKYSSFQLLQKAKFLQSELEASDSSIGSVDIVPTGEYEVQVLLDKNKISQLGISLNQIAATIKSYNKNTPIGNYTIDELNYDFRFDGELTSIQELEEIVIRSGESSFLKLGDVATIQMKYNDESIRKLGFSEDYGYNFVELTVFKSNSANIFEASSIAKENLEKIMKEESELSGLDFVYYNDISEFIIEDYVSLANTAWQTLALVFITILFFISLKEALIITIILPLSFFVTFVVLNLFGYSMNFLTNFSLVLALTIAIDTIIIVIEGATEKQKLGYNKKTAVLMAVNEFKKPLISGTLTTLSVFLPLMFLPGVMGKFLAYIPITVFSTLLASLIIALTLSSAIYVLLAKDRKYYYIEEKVEENMDDWELQLLADQREGKAIAKHEKLSRKDKFLEKLGDRYYNYLEKLLLSKPRRLFVIFLPVVLMILSIIVLSPKIGFTLFPSTDEGDLTITATAQEGKTEDSLSKYINEIDKVVSSVPELKLYSITVEGKKLLLYFEAVDKEERERDIFTIEKELVDNLQFLKVNGLELASNTTTIGPPTDGGAVGIKLVAEDNSQLETLKKVSEDFENFLENTKGTKNLYTSSSETPGQFIFEFDDAKLAQLGLTPDSILNELYFYTNGMKAGSIKSKFEDNDIVLKISEFEDNLSPDDILNVIIPTQKGNIRVGDVANYTFTKAVSSIDREDGSIVIKVTVDPATGYLPTDIQPKLDEFASNYNYPEGISYVRGGENEENSELITSMIISLLVALFMIFFILVVQFNSFIQPLIILFSVVLSILGINIGLYLTGNPYSMTFMIGFIALAGVVINDAIVLIDRTNSNIARGIDNIHAVASAGKSRLQPVLVTTITTALGVFPLALQDAFWAGLGFTIMFGIMAGSLLTLMCIPPIYYGILMRAESNKENIFKRIYKKIKFKNKKDKSVTKK